MARPQRPAGIGLLLNVQMRFLKSIVNGQNTPLAGRWEKISVGLGTLLGQVADQFLAQFIDSFFEF
jgi:hypothetical protein